MSIRRVSCRSCDSIGLWLIICLQKLTGAAMRFTFAILTLGAFALAPALARAEELVILPTRPGVTVRFLFEAPDAPQAAVLLFAGSAGGLGLKMLNDAPK